MEKAILTASAFALIRCIALGVFFVPAAALAVSWTVRVDERNGLPAIYRGGASALSSKFVFWGKDWQWAEQQVKFSIAAPFEYEAAGSNPVLDFELSNHISATENQSLTWNFELIARSERRPVIGGGISFRFDPAAFESELGKPELLPGNRGWTWGRAPGSRLEMRFDPPLADVYFERGQPSEIRAFFYKGHIPRGQRRHVATLRLSGDIAIGPTISEKFGLSGHTTWPKAAVDWRTSPVDLSFLNAPDRPAGKRGFVKAVGSVLEFDDGSPARFWGTNLTAYALFGTSQENARQQARRISALGFNLVRLHHHDSPWVNPNIFGNRNSADTQKLDPAMLDRLDWWIKCLKDEGVYVWLDLHVQRQLKSGDGIEFFEEIRKSKITADLKGYSYVNDSIREAMKRFNEAYVNHVNRYTGLRYREDPAIVAMLISNENDITQHFGNALLPDGKVPNHTAIYLREAENFARKHGLPRDRTWRSWEPGPAKLFLNELEHRFNADMIQHLRDLGVRVPIATTSTWGGNPLSSLPALTAGGIVDVHSYGGIAELERNPLFAPTLVHWIAAARVAGKPLSVTEWNVERFPVPDRHSIPLYMAASAGHQGWNALMQYGYAQIPLNGPGGASNWHAFNDPGMLAMLPAAALLYRRGHVREADTVYAFAPDLQHLFGMKLSPQTSVALRTAPEKGKLVIVLPATKELPWLKQGTIPSGAKVIHDPNALLIERNSVESVSDTGELRRNWERGVYTIDTRQTQAATGWIGGRKVALADTEIALTTKNASVAIQSLDERPIASSSAILISLGATAVPDGQNQAAFYSEPLEGRLMIRATKGKSLYALRDSTGQSTALPVPYLHGRYQIDLDRTMRAHWFILK